MLTKRISQIIIASRSTSQSAVSIFSMGVIGKKCYRYNFFYGHVTGRNRLSCTKCFSLRLQLRLCQRQLDLSEYHSARCVDAHWGMDDHPEKCSRQWFNFQQIVDRLQKWLRRSSREVFLVRQRETLSIDGNWKLEAKSRSSVKRYREMVFGRVRIFPLE